MLYAVLFINLHGAILGIANADPDAFDYLRVEDEGVEYVCEPKGYSKLLDYLCDHRTRQVWAVPTTITPRGDG